LNRFIDLSVRKDLNFASGDLGSNIDIFREKRRMNMGISTDLGVPANNRILNEGTLINFDTREESTVDDTSQGTNDGTRTNDNIRTKDGGGVNLSSGMD
jgi:hypothetical protein